jgi:23S rRNA (guanosine2251-2'-O)-methyltransferase
LKFKQHKTNISELNIFGINPVKEAILTNKATHIYISKNFTQNNRVLSLLKTAQNKKIPTTIIEHNNFQKQFGTKSGQNIVATISLTFLKSIDDLIINNNENSKVLIVDKVQDPRNLGALIRSAESAGFEAIILSSNNAAKINSTVVESSSGAISHIPIIDDQNINQIIKKLKDNNYWVIGLDMDGDKEYEDYDFYGNIALVIGSEGSGISKLTKSLCDQIYKISMKGKTESLNVSVAAGIMMFKISNS